jgi:CheY-like chemotaxis protein
LVEDQDDLRDAIRDVLTHFGYDVLSAADPDEALAVSGRHGDRIALLITDVVMPRMNGRELADRLVETNPSMKVLFMSGYTADEALRAAVRSGRSAFLQKPFFLSELSSKLRELLDNGKPGLQKEEAAFREERLFGQTEE